MSTKKDLKTAKTLFRKSLTGGFVDSVKVRSILKALAFKNPTHMVGILRNYKRLLESALSKEEVIVETATQISNTAALEKEVKAKTHAKRITFRVNPEIVVGAKIIHGDWVFDSTLEAKLEQLTMSN